MLVRLDAQGSGELPGRHSHTVGPVATEVDGLGEDDGDGEIGASVVVEW